MTLFKKIILSLQNFNTPDIQYIHFGLRPLEECESLYYLRFFVPWKPICTLFGAISSCWGLLGVDLYVLSLPLSVFKNFSQQCFVVFRVKLLHSFWWKLFQNILWLVFMLLHTVWYSFKIWFPKCFLLLCRNTGVPVMA